VQVAREELKSFLQTLQKPLVFASKDSFANIHIVKDLESFIRTAYRKIESVPLSPALTNQLRTLKEIFYDFDNLSIQAKRERICAGLSLLEKVQRECFISTGNDFEINRSILSRPIEEFRGIGKVMSQGLRKKGIECLEDLLYFFPVRYEDRRTIKRISTLEIGEKGTFIGEIMLQGEVFYGRKKVYEMLIGDGKGVIKAKWFNYNQKVMKSRFRKGQKLLLYGEVSAYRFQKEIHHPDVEIIEENDVADIHFKSIVPVYSQIDRVHQKRVRGVMKEIVENYGRYVPESLPDSLMKKYNLLHIKEAIEKLHFPKEMNDVCRTSPAYKTLIFDELFFLELGLALKRENRCLEQGISLMHTPLPEKFLNDVFPFSLTKAQTRVLDEIREDMQSSHPMSRLLQGDVGSGKTVIAFLASLLVVGNGYQSAIMAPTEILAEQHYRNLSHFSKEMGLKTAFLRSKMRKKEKEDICRAIKEQKIDIVIGTHALIQEDVEFNALGLAVIDEQHRFGVLQRALLKKKGYYPHILVMTATPIPRTLSMTVFGELDVSVIDELPSGRQPVKTRVFRDKDKALVYQKIREELQKGRQVYIVYPLIEESEELDLKDATNMREHLQSVIFPAYKVSLLHGRMKGEEKESVMSAFKSGKINILVSTTVIEVGIDIPNATVMLIEHAERFGLAQLHQLRGRVGRGAHDSHCFLLAYKIGSLDAYKRLKIMERTSDGFRIAEEDLKIRGPGDFLGTRQSGLPDFRVANFIEDLFILRSARMEAFKIINEDPQLGKKEHRVMKEVLIARWKGRLELARVG
jgi:ATP-dependent DNA helicase RecG